MERSNNIFDREGRNDLHWTAMLYHNGKFYMFYNYGTAVHGPTPYMTGMARSEDGKKFDIRKEVVLHPDFGFWDSQLIEAHSIIRVNGKWRMYYCGFDGNWRIGFAESEDLCEWKKYPEPILDLGDYWENTHVGDPTVILFKGRYLMYYAGKGEVWQVGLAESKDGIEWNRHPENPIMKADKEWCNGCVCLSGVINYKRKLLATAHGYNTEDEKFRTKLFKSENGIEWIPLDMTIEPGRWNNSGIVHAEPMFIDDKLIVYFTGIRKGNPNQHRIGRVVYEKEEIPL